MKKKLIALLLAFASATALGTFAACGEAHEHTYGDPVWTWADDFSTATAAFTCSVCGDAQTVEAAVTSEITDPTTCAAEGVTTYTATVTFEGEEYSDTKTDGIDKIAHTITHVDKVDATCTEDGCAEYWYCSVCETYFSDEACTTVTTLEALTIPATGHSYGEPTWSWSGYTSATATFTCSNNSSHTETVTATGTAITSEITTAATCTTTGVMTYTATVTLDGKTYTTETTETIAALGHSFTNYVSNNDATCTTDGTKTATCDHDGCTVTDTITDSGSATGHSYSEPTWTWTQTSDGYTATAKFTCSACKDEQTVDATVTSETTEATCTTAGSIVYTATATFNSAEYTDTKTVTIAATNHTYGTELTYNSTDGKWYKTCSVCSGTEEVTDTSGYTLLACDATSLAAAVGASSSIKLSADVEIDADDLQTKIAALSDNATLVIDVAGHKLTISDEDSNTPIDIENGKSLTIKDSTNTSGSSSTATTLVLTNRSGSSSNIRVLTNSSVTLDSVVVSATGPVLFPKGDAAAVTVTNSRLVTTGAYVVATNSAVLDNYNVVITLKNSYLETQSSAYDSCAVMINVAGTLNIENCEIVGQKLGVVVRAGTATMTNTSVTCSVPVSAITTNTNWAAYTTHSSKWGSGTAIAMGAVVVGDDSVRSSSSAAYCKDATLTMTGCTLSYEITGDTDGTYDYLEIGLYLMRSNVTTEYDNYNTTVTVDSTTTINGLVFNICQNNTYESMTATSTLTGYDGTVYTAFASDSTTLASAIAQGSGTILLTADISLTDDAFNGDTFSSDTTQTVDITIDVAGHTLTITQADTNSSIYGAPIYVKNGTSLTFTDSTNTSGSASTENAKLVLNNRTKVDKSCISIKTGSSVTLKNIVVSSTGCTLFPSGDAAAVNVINSKITTTGTYVIGTNASTTNNNVAITVDNSYLIGANEDYNSCVVMINVSGTLNISDSTIEGQMQGVQVRAGTATITNTTITCTMLASKITTKMTGYTTDPTTWTSGEEVAMGAVVVGNNKSSDYNADAILTMTGCTLSYTITGDTTADYSQYAIALYLHRSGSTTYKTKVTLTNTTINSGIVVNISAGDEYTSTLTYADGSAYTGTVYTSYSDNSWATTTTTDDD